MSEKQKDHKKEKDTQLEKEQEQRVEQEQKKRDYKKELEQAVAENQELKEQLLRKAAEFDNFRKRVQAEKEEIHDITIAHIIEKILPFLDELDLVIEKSREEQDFQSLLQGVEMVQKNVFKILTSLGLKPMDSVGQPFDPEKHHAMMQQEAEDVEPDTVINELKKGYMVNDRVVRHAEVIVSK